MDRYLLGAGDDCGDTGESLDPLGYNYAPFGYAAMQVLGAQQ
jgi:hypothetical protein